MAVQVSNTYSKSCTGAELQLPGDLTRLCSHSKGEDSLSSREQKEDSLQCKSVLLVPNVPGCRYQFDVETEFPSLHRLHLYGR